jgi:hypothetical protein
MKKLLFLTGVVLAGCRSEQAVFQFQPGASSQAVARAAVPAEAMLAAEVRVAPAPAMRASSLPPRQRRSHPQPQEQRVTTLASSPLLPAATPQHTVAQRLLPHLVPKQRATSGAAENGLGRVALFFIGVVLGVLAGLAALVNVIFGVGFFTALGYTAAGLVVLFLLYRLFSGGKKKHA